MRRFAVLLAVGISLQFVAVSGAQAEEDVHGADHKHQSVRITSSRLQPNVLEIHTDEAIGWLNYSRDRAVISFDREVAKKMTCTSKSVFRLTGERLESAPIQAQQFASLCTLAPGEYTYEVQLMTGVGSVASSGRKLEGTIRVQ